MVASDDQQTHQAKQTDKISPKIATFIFQAEAYTRDTTRQHKTIQDNTRQCKTTQDNARQNKTTNRGEAVTRDADMCNGRTKMYRLLLV